jgi:hypothetical protein
MSIFFDRFAKSITGVLSGFDRLVFHGHLRSSCIPKAYSLTCGIAKSY